MAAWDRFLTEDDRKVIAGGNLRAPPGPGVAPALLVIDMQVTAVGENRPIHAIPVQQRLLATARAAGLPVIYS